MEQKDYTVTFDLKVKRLSPDAKIPNKAHQSDLGWDLFSNETIIVPPFGRELVRTGIAVQFPPNVGGIIKDRSGMASKRGLFIHAGVIDPDYRGEVQILMFNASKAPVEIKKGDKIAQMILMPVFMVSSFEVVEELDETVRGESGFGSTGT